MNAMEFAIRTNGNPRTAKIAKDCLNVVAGAGATALSVVSVFVATFVRPSEYIGRNLISWKALVVSNHSSADIHRR